MANKSISKWKKRKILHLVTVGNSSCSRTHVAKIFPINGATILPGKQFLTAISRAVPCGRIHHKVQIRVTSDPFWSSSNTQEYHRVQPVLSSVRDMSDKRLNYRRNTHDYWKRNWKVWACLQRDNLRYSIDRVVFYWEMASLSEILVAKLQLPKFI